MPDPDEDAGAPTAPESDALSAVRAADARQFFAAAAVLALAAAALTLWLPYVMPQGHRPLLLAILLAFGGACLLSMRLPAARTPRAMLMIGVAAIGVIVAGVMLNGFGIDAPALGFLALLCFAVAAVASRGVALVVAALSMAAVAALAWRDTVVGTASGTAAPDVQTLWLLQHAMLIAGSVAAGGWLAARTTRHVQRLDDRERRFNGLLGLAADAYWELDAGYRIAALTLPGADAGTQSLEPEVIGQVPWTLTALRIDEETLDLVQANLDARLPVLDLPMQWREAGGRIRHLVVSGEPRNDARGVFLGYWGVVRDVSADVTARQALAATEGRYQDLFEHMPTPLVLHRNGHVIEANPAAQALLLGDASQPMAGMDLLGFYEGGDSRERARRRLEEIEALPIGLALPVTDYRLIARKGRTLSVRATGVRVEATDGAATLSIFVDDTERRVAEDAVRRSETMLSHLVATSPDVITLSELDSGRYVMVNTTFERVTGLAASEVVGHTALELGLWADPTERDVLVARLRQDGAVKDMPLTLARKGAPPVAMRASGARFMMDRREYLVMNARDVSASERDRLEREAILQTASIGIALTRGQQFVIANACLERLCGWPQGTLAGQPARVLWGGDDEQLRAAAAIEARISRGDVVEFETRVQRADGSSFLGRITANPTDPARPAEGGTVWIIEDVTGQRQAEGALARARDEAETANRAKSSFLANTSHELRTPLNGIVGLARLAGNPELDEAVRRQHLSQISESAQSLTGIISDILDLSKIESGKLTLESTTFDLEGLLNSLHGAYAMLAQARGLTLTLQIAPEAAGFVRGDALRVRQIVSNFVSNALKFTEYGGVDLSAVRVDEQTVRIAVRDSGPGIDDATQARLFRPFTQADDSTTRRFGGTGLGLSICRELAILMGGQVGVDSAAGRGSVFWAQLPMPATVGAPESSNDVLPDLGGVHVLLVEDNPVNMMIAVALLEQWGVRVEQAADGAQALAALDHALREGRSFDVVLMDLQMPGMSGYEATRSLRRRPGAQNLPVIALTAAALVTEREEAFKAGMNDFLTKPIDADRLRATLSHWVVRRVEGVNNLAPEQRNS